MKFIKKFSDKVAAGFIKAGLKKLSKEELYFCKNMTRKEFFEVVRSRKKGDRLPDKFVNRFYDEIKKAK